MNKTRLLAAFLLALLGSLWAFRAPATAFGTETGAYYDWIVNIETAELKTSFQHGRSSLRNVVIAKITYRKGSTGEKDSTRYEDLWYCQSKPIGLERYHTLNLPPGDGIAICIKNRSASCSYSEAWASANATLRVMLDAYVRRNAVIEVVVPLDAFNSIADGFRRQGLDPLPEEGSDEGVAASLLLHLVSEPDGMTQTFSYQR
jgi:hypothetical protein